MRKMRHVAPAFPLSCSRSGYFVRSLPYPRAHPGIPDEKSRRGGAGWIDKADHIIVYRKDLALLNAVLYHQVAPRAAPFGGFGLVITHHMHLILNIGDPVDGCTDRQAQFKSPGDALRASDRQRSDDVDPSLLEIDAIELCTTSSVCLPAGRDPAAAITSDRQARSR